ncbi:MAG: sulfatase [Bacteroidia bacterium]
MRHYYLLLLIIFLSCQSGNESKRSARPDKPNIVLIFADDMGYGDLSSYGHPNNRTPRLDQMAREGAKLTGFYVAAPVCSPSRAALLTGRYPVRCGMPGNVGADSPGGLPASEITLAEALKEQGYKTAAFGKWHLGARTGYFPTDNGFDECLGILYSNDMEPPYIQTERPLHLYRDTLPTDEYPVDQTTITERYTQEAIRFIKESKDEPFFLYLPHAMPHLPVATSSNFADQSFGGRYGDVIETIDWSTGAIVDGLKAEGLEENTIFIFTSDNGPWNNLPPRMYNAEAVEKWDTGSAGPFRGSKASTWEGGHRVPAIIRWPGKIPAGQMRPELLTSMDIYPTLLSLAGAELPADRTYDGHDMWPLLTGEADSPHDYFYYFWIRELQGVRDQRWKLLLKPLETDGEVVPQLYHLGRDPYERFDVAADHPEIVERLLSQMRTFAGELEEAKLPEGY